MTDTDQQTIPNPDYTTAPYRETGIIEKTKFGEHIIGVFERIRKPMEFEIIKDDTVFIAYILKEKP